MSGKLNADGFPNVLGCIDGTFVKVISPHENEADFVNRKGVHYLNIQQRILSSEAKSCRIQIYSQEFQCIERGIKESEEKDRREILEEDLKTETERHSIDTKETCYEIIKTTSDDDSEAGLAEMTDLGTIEDHDAFVRSEDEVMELRRRIQELEREKEFNTRQTMTTESQPSAHSMQSQYRNYGNHGNGEQQPYRWNQQNSTYYPDTRFSETAYPMRNRTESFASQDSYKSRLPFFNGKGDWKTFMVQFQITQLDCRLLSIFSVFIIRVITAVLTSTQTLPLQSLFLSQVTKDLNPFLVLYFLLHLGFFEKYINIKIC
ncbi:HARBI1 [Mytilus edulis]|uniref:HARBI1 n=1 Tax=Mytilus edulis TaxID=6550 RepID=A0A8S3VQS0_MYTED|nr:HARBI1 [Mytilus edulis]